MAHLSVKHGSYLAVALAIVEILVISLGFDAATVNTEGAGSLAQLLQYSGVLIQWVSVFTGAYLIVYLVGDPKTYRTSSAHVTPQNEHWLVFATLNLVIFALFYVVTHSLFGSESTAKVSISVLVIAWPLLAITTAATLLRTAVSFSFAWHSVRQYRSSILLCAIIATLVCTTSLLSKNLWPTFIQPTFFFSEWILEQLGPTISAPARLHLGIDQFIVHISSQCSGIEGMGLAVSFTLLYLFMARDNLKLPHALLLLPLAALLSWLLNVVRITALILLGEYVSAEFAVGGFHSQAGWFTFIGLALAIIYCFDKAPWFRKSRTKTSPANHIISDTNSAILACFIAFLVGALISGLSEDSVNWLYSAKAGLGALALVIFWRTLNISPPIQVAESIGYGLLVLLVWVILIPADPSYNEAFATELATMSVGLQISWLAVRFIGSIAVAPLIEELVFRSYLLSRIAGQPVEHHRPMAFNWPAIAISSIAFGAIHNQWLAGIAAGILYAIARCRGNLASAMIAHAVTNACLCIYAMGFNQWSYL